MDTDYNSRLWPDEQEKAVFQAGSGGRRRGIGFDKVVECWRDPLVEKILKSYLNPGSAKMALMYLRQKIEMFPPGVWFLSTKEVEGELLGSRGLQTCVVAVYLGLFEDPDRRILINPVKNRLSLKELEEHERLVQAVKELKWKTIEQQLWN